MLPLSNKLKLKKIVQLVAEILAKEATPVCKICNICLLWKYGTTALAYIHFKHVQTVLKFTLLFWTIFDPNILFFQIETYTQMKIIYASSF